MQVNVNEVSGQILDYLAAKCLGYTLTSDGISNLLERGRELLILGPNSSSLSFSPSTNPAHAWPIIELDRIWIKFPFMVEGDVEAIHGHFGFPKIINAFGPTALIATMRCFVKSKFGNTVEIPDDVFELLSASSVS